MSYEKEGYPSRDHLFCCLSCRLCLVSEAYGCKLGAIVLSIAHVRLFCGFLYLNKLFLFHFFLCVAPLSHLRLLGGGCQSAGEVQMGCIVPTSESVSPVIVCLHPQYQSVYHHT